MVGKGELFLLALSTVAGFAGGCGAAAAELLKKPNDRWQLYVLAYGVHGAAVGLTVPVVLNLAGMDLSVTAVVGVSAMLGVSGMVSSALINSGISAFLKSRGLEIRRVENKD